MAIGSSPTRSTRASSRRRWIRSRSHPDLIRPDAAQGLRAHGTLRAMFRRGGEQRHLATVLFTDIVGSTERAAEVGDRRWREVIAEHHAILRRSLKANSGREVD